MPGTKPRFKYGTYANYKNLPTKYDDTLYFITDRGLIFKGQREVTKHITITSHIDNNDDTQSYITISDNSTSSVKSFNIYTQSAINAILSAHYATVGHAASGTPGQSGYDDGRGHVALLDDIDSVLNAATGGTAATPLAVKNALADAKAYTDHQISDLSGVMVFKGTIGQADAFQQGHEYAVGDYCEYEGRTRRCNTAHRSTEWNNTESQYWDVVENHISDLPTPADTPKYKKGWAYRVIIAGTYAGQHCEVGDTIVAVKDASGSSSSVVNADWSVIQGNEGTVYSDNNFSSNDLIIGTGTSTKVTSIASSGQSGKYLKNASGVPTWMDIVNEENGFAYMEAVHYQGGITSLSEQDFTVSSVPSGFNKKEYGMVAIKFPINVGGNTIEHSKVAFVASNPTEDDWLEIIYRGSAIPNGIIKSGETALFMFVKNTTSNELELLFLATDTPNPTNTSQITVDTCGIAVTQNWSGTTVSASLSNYSLVTNTIVAVNFTSSHHAFSSMQLDINGTGAKPVYWKGSALANGALEAGDTATMLYDGTNYNILAVDRLISNSINMASSGTASSNKFVTEGAVYSAVDGATLFWEVIEDSNS